MRVAVPAGDDKSRAGCRWRCKLPVGVAIKDYLSANKIGQDFGEVFRGNLKRGSKNSLLESLILAQNERWRRG